MTTYKRYEQAKKIIINSENFSIEYLQRKLCVGYNEAAEYITKMIEEGIINSERTTLLINQDQTFDEWIGVDLDGTLAYYDKWRGIGHIGEAIQPMVAFVQQLLADGKNIKIFTARASNPESIPYIREWLIENNLSELEITNMKDFGMIMLYDDRCIQVTSNSGEIIKYEDN